MTEVIDDEGCIEHFENAHTIRSCQYLDNLGSPLLVVPPGAFLLSTFCDLHLHAPQFLYQGTGLDLPLMEWLDDYAFKAEERLDADPNLARRVYSRLAQRLIESGTGTVLLFGTIKEDTKYATISRCQPGN